MAGARFPGADVTRAQGAQMGAGNAPGSGRRASVRSSTQPTKHARDSVTSGCHTPCILRVQTRMYGTHGNRLWKPFWVALQSARKSISVQTTMMTAGDLSAKPRRSHFEKRTESRRAFLSEVRARGAQAMRVASSSTESRRSAKQADETTGAFRI